MKPRILFAVFALPLLAFALYGCGAFGDGGAIDISAAAEDPVDPTPVEAVVLPCLAKEVLPANVHLAAILRNIADYEAEEPETILAKEDPFWQALLNAPMTLADGDFYTPTTPTLAGIVTEVLETMARQKLGTGFNSANCIGISVISDDNEFLSWGAAGLGEGERELSFPQFISHKLGFNGDDPAAHIQLAWDDMPVSIEDTLRFFEEEMFSLLGDDNTSYEFVEITEEKVSDDADYAPFGGLVGDDHSSCYVLMMRNEERDAAVTNTPFMFLCQHDIDAEGLHHFWMGTILAGDSNVGALEVMLANARAYMDSTSKLTYNENSFRWGSEFNTNLAKAMEEVEDFDPDIMLFMDLAKLRQQVISGIQAFNIFKSDPEHLSLGLGVSLDAQAKAALVIQLQATPEGVEGYKDMMVSGNVDMNNLGAFINFGGIDISGFGLSTVADGLVFLGDKLSQWTP